MATEVAIAHSVPVATRVQQALAINEPVEKFLKRYTTTARTDDVLVFQATAGTADQAVAMADTLADQFLSYRREQDDQQVEVLRQSLAGRITAASGQHHRPRFAARGGGHRHHGGRGDQHDRLAAARIRARRS